MNFEKIWEQFKNFDYRKASYPAISLVFLALVVAFFIISADFISANMDKAFSPIDEGSVKSQIIQVDMAGYYAVAKKLGIKTR